MYAEIKPGSRVMSFVEAYWTAANSSEKTVEMTIMPDLCCDIMLSINTTGHESFAVGCMTRAAQASIRPGETAMGIRFRPGCARAVLGIPLNEITDTAPPLNDINARTASILHIETLPATADDLRERLDGPICSLFQENGRDSGVAAAIRIIELHHGIMPVEALAERLGLTLRSLERRFLASTGIGPKLFSRITRFRHARDILAAHESIPLAHAALEAGYYDQAHFNRDYKKFSGATPKK